MSIFSSPVSFKRYSLKILLEICEYVVFYFSFSVQETKCVIRILIAHIRRLTNVYIQKYLFTICSSRIIAEDRLILGLMCTTLSLAYDKICDG